MASRCQAPGRPRDLTGAAVAIKGPPNEFSVIARAGVEERTQ